MLLPKVSPLQEISLKNDSLRLYIKRDDLLHPHISGNKWRKLKYNLRALQEQKKDALLTFGGAFSNHIAAAAAAGQAYRLKTIGVIRGERPKNSNPTLRYAESCGMHLHFISRTDYRKKEEQGFIEELKEEFGDFYLLPEGGTNTLALPGCAEIIAEIDQEILSDYYATACGTGGTVSGMISGLRQGKVIGFSVLKGDFMRQEVEKLLEAYRPTSQFSDYTIFNEYHFGGYAKYKAELIDFINNFKREQGIQLDPIYTGKLFFGLFDLIEKGYFPKGSTITAVHTGGLQGIAGFNERYGDLVKFQK